MVQLSELSETVETLVKRASALEKENAKLWKQACQCEEGTKERLIEVEDSDVGLEYVSAKESRVPSPVPAQVLPAVSG